MTEAALSGGAPAPVETPGAPITPPVDQPQALGSQTPVAEKPIVEPKPEPAKNAGEAVRKANEALKAKEAAKAAEPGKDAPKPDVKAEAANVPEAKEGQPEAAKSTPEPSKSEAAAPKPAADPNSPHRIAPSRFDDAAKAEWDAAPESIKGAVHRTIRELEQGHQKYRADAEAYESVRQYDDLAKRNGGNLKSSLERVTAIEDAFTQNPIQGFQKVADHFGLNLRAVAAHIMGQKPEQVQAQQSHEVTQLKQTIQQLQQQVGGVTEHLQQQRVATLQSDVATFQSDPAHSRFDELAGDIKFFLESGRVDASLSPKERLSEAYKLAERLNPATPAASANGAHTPTTPLAQTQTPTPAPPNPAGQKSVSGAPASGSDPAPRKSGPAPSIREALDKAKRRAG